MIKVGIIGFGVVGQRRKKYILKNKFFDLVCISDISFKKNYTVKNINFYKDYEKFLNHNLDAVFITLPNYLAVKVTSFFLKKNIHVFCEKPPARNFKELKYLEKIFKKNKRLKLKYGFNHRYHGSVKKAEKLIDSKIYGKIINLRAVYGKSKIVTFGKNEWRANRRFSGGGILLDQGIHLLDLITKFGGKFDEFKSFISKCTWPVEISMSHNREETKECIDWLIKACDCLKRWMPDVIVNYEDLGKEVDKYRKLQVRIQKRRKKPYFR